MKQELELDFETSVYRGEIHLEHVLELSVDVTVDHFTDTIHDEIGKIPVVGIDDIKIHHIYVWNKSEYKGENFAALIQSEKDHILKQIAVRAEEKFYSDQAKAGVA